jgi:hypothetical protein
VFAFDRRSRGQRRAGEWFVFAVPVAAIAFVVLDHVLERAVGAVGGILIALFLVGVPLGAVWGLAEGDRTAVRALVRGVALGILAALGYLWVFGGWLAYRGGT